jgi:hypothetical protein
MFLKGDSVALNGCFDWRPSKMVCQRRCLSFLG